VKGGYYPRRAGYSGYQSRGMQRVLSFLALLASFVGAQQLTDAQIGVVSARLAESALQRCVYPQLKELKLIRIQLGTRNTCTDNTRTQRDKIFRPYLQLPPTTSIASIFSRQRPRPIFRHRERCCQQPDNSQ